MMCALPHACSQVSTTNLPSNHALFSQYEITNQCLLYRLQKKQNSAIVFVKKKLKKFSMRSFTGTGLVLWFQWLTNTARWESSKGFNHNLNMFSITPLCDMNIIFFFRTGIAQVRAPLRRKNARFENSA